MLHLRVAVRPAHVPTATVPCVRVLRAACVSARRVIVKPVRPMRAIASRVVPARVAVVRHPLAVDCMQCV